MVAVPHEHKGEQIVVVATDKSLTLECLREFIKNNGYPELYLPKIILIKDKIPTTATGKIDNFALKKEVMLQLGI